jgi:hypothetical protein
MMVPALIGLDHKGGRGSLRLDTITQGPIQKLVDSPRLKVMKSRVGFKLTCGKHTRRKPSQSLILLLAPSHLLIFASRAACPMSGFTFLLCFQPKGLSDTPLYKENSRGLSISYVEVISDCASLSFLGPLHKDEVLRGGIGAGAVVTDVAKDKARDILVLLRVILRVATYRFCYLSSLV